MESAILARRRALNAEIRSLMGRYETSQGRLAEVLGVNQSTLSRKLRGDAAWAVDELETIAEFFHTTAAALLASAHNPRSVNFRSIPALMGQLSLDDPMGQAHLVEVA